MGSASRGEGGSSRTSQCPRRYRPSSGAISWRASDGSGASRRGGVGGLLADEMGLGKTVQAITLLLTRKDDGPSLVVAPTSVIGGWRGELERFAPSLDV